MVEFRYRTDEVTEQPSVTLDAFLDQSNATAVRLEPDDDARALIPFLDRLTLDHRGCLDLQCSPSLGLDRA
jgi:hypothetical protein